MDSNYSDDDLLLLSGIQHFAFCRRQWALIHLEQIWNENVRTVEGKFLHERADDPFLDENRKDRRVVRAMPLISRSLGFQGVADVVEFIREQSADHSETVALSGLDGRWKVYPIEYKRGKPKKDERDEVQLCAQGMALEEMMYIKITEGAIYYAQIRRRERVVFDDILRQRVIYLSDQMHEMLKSGQTPYSEPGKHCSLCSLAENCQPRLTLRKKSVSSYIARMVNRDEGSEADNA